MAVGSLGMNVETEPADVCMAAFWTKHLVHPVRWSTYALSPGSLGVQDPEGTDADAHFLRGWCSADPELAAANRQREYGFLDM